MIVIIIANSVDPDEILHYVAFIRAFTVCKTDIYGGSYTSDHMKFIKRASGEFNDLI